MFRIILLSLLTLLGVQFTPQPVRLQKKLSFNEKLRVWYCRHEWELLFLLILSAIIIFAVAVITLCPPMDMWNNHFQEVI